MMPPTSLDGTDITGATIDGTDVQEITVDGQTVFTAQAPLPDAGDLHARYSAIDLGLSDGDPVNTWTDETGNGHDLTGANAPTFKTNIINGQPVVRFDGLNDFLDVSFSDIPTPYTIFIVHADPDGSGQYTIHDEEAVGNVARFGPSGGNYRMFSGQGIFGNAATTSPLIHSEFYDNGPNSILRRNGTQTANGDCGNNALGGFKLATDGTEFSFAEIDIGEVLIYPQDKSSIFSDVEQYLSDEWGISL
jgi:hypothetical protein